MTLSERTKIRRAGRLDIRRRKIGGSRCVRCGLEDLRALQLSNVVLCANCRLEIQGLAPIERHHILGRKLSSFAVDLPANFHAVLTYLGLDHPPEISSSRDLKILYARRDWLEVLSEITANEIESLEKEKGDHDDI